VVYYQQHLNVNRLWLEHIMYEVCLQERHVLLRTLSTVRYTLMNLQWFRTVHVHMTVYEI
jgi:hypothetical protein